MRQPHAERHHHARTPARQLHLRAGVRVDLRRRLAVRFGAHRGVGIDQHDHGGNDEQQLGQHGFPGGEDAQHGNLTEEAHRRRRQHARHLQRVHARAHELEAQVVDEQAGHQEEAVERQAHAHLEHQHADDGEDGQPGGDAQRQVTEGDGRGHAQVEDGRLRALAQDGEEGQRAEADEVAACQCAGGVGVDELPPPLLRQDVLSIEDLKEGMVLSGTVRNVVAFGAFVDIGVKQDGLVHISQLADRYVKNPFEVVSVGDVVKVKVTSIDAARGRIGLSMKEVN